MIDYVQNYRGK